MEGPTRGALAHGRLSLLPAGGAHWEREQHHGARGLSHAAGEQCVQEGEGEQGEAFSTQVRGFSTQADAFCAHVLAKSAEAHAKSAEAHAESSEAHTYSTRAHTYSTKAHTHSTEAQRYSAQAQSFTAAHHTSATQVFTNSTEAQTFSAQGNTFGAQAKPQAPQPNPLSARVMDFPLHGHLCERGPLGKGAQRAPQLGEGAQAHLKGPQRHQGSACVCTEAQWILQGEATPRHSAGQRPVLSRLLRDLSEEWRRSAHLRLSGAPPELPWVLPGGSARVP